MSSEPGTGKRFGVLIVIVLVVTIPYFIYVAEIDKASKGCREGCGADSSSGTPGSTSPSYLSGNEGAYDICRERIKKMLKVPSTASFPGSHNSGGVAVRGIGEKTYQVTAHVDAQNVFGAKLRKKWFCQVREKDKGWRFMLVKIIE